METPPARTATYFDGWYADMVRSPVKDEIMQRHLGLPPQLLSTSLLTWEGIGEVVAALRLSSTSTLLDLACGRGGYGLEVAARTGCRLVGIDFSAEALRQAGEHAGRRGVPADFRIGDLAATGMDPASADAVLCVDAIQFAQPPAAAYRELRRVLGPGGRAVLTCWEPLDRTTTGFRSGCGPSTSVPGCQPPASRSRCASAPAGGPQSGPCGRRAPPSTPVTTRPCARSTTRASAPSRCSTGSVG